MHYTVILFFKGAYFKYFIQYCFICLPSDYTVSEDAEIELRTVPTLAIAVRRANHSARSHPLDCNTVTNLFCV
jgi:hypothetical protein